MGSIALLPTGLALISAIIASVLKKPNKSTKVPKTLVIIASVLLVIAIAKLFVKNEVKGKEEFKLEQLQSQQEAINELEELENLDAFSDSDSIVTMTEISLEN
ncbi:MAG TPA: hypothetical protein GXZ87_04005 [Bacteroidales bacterium]|nr:hypothetical protein [Bacteroidales bacterium]